MEASPSPTQASRARIEPSATSAEDRPQLVCVDPARVPEFWPHVSPLVDLAYEHGGCHDQRERVEADVLAGAALLWLAWSAQRKIEAVMITDLIAEDGATICRIRALAGTVMRRWLKLIEEVEAYARRERCTEVRYIGRMGWVRMLGPNYKVMHVICAKAL